MDSSNSTNSINREDERAREGFSIASGSKGGVRRPLTFITLAYCVGLVLARLFYPVGWGMFFPFGFIFLLLFYLSLFYWRQHFSDVPLVVALLPFFLFLAVFNYQGAAARCKGNLAEFAGERLTLEGSIVAEPVVYSERTVYLLAVENIKLDGQDYPAEGRVRLTAGYPPSQGKSFLYGERVRVTGRLIFPTGSRNPGSFARHKFLLAQGAGAQLYISLGQGKVLASNSNDSAWQSSFMSLVYRLKSRTLTAFQDVLGTEESALLGGILFGLRSGLQERVAENFRGAGVAHLLAVSGLHVGLVAILVFKLLGWLKVKEDYRYLGSIPVVLLFVFFTGFRPAVLRALLMFFALVGGKLLGRERDSLTALSLAALATLVYNPFFLFTPGFQLSYAGVLFILFLYPELKSFLNFLPVFLQDLTAVSLAAQLGVLPLTAYYFGQISLIALLSNLVLLPFMSLVLGGGLLAAVLVNIWSGAGVLFLFLLSPLLTFFLIITDAFAAVPLASLGVSFSLAFLIFYYACFLVIINRQQVKQHLISCVASCNFSRERIILVTLLLVCLLLVGGLLAGALQSRILEVVFLDVGQGASVYVRTPSGKNLLVDTGGALFTSGDWDVGREIVVPFLKAKEVEQLDILFITQPSVDHYRGAFAVLAAFPPRLLAVGCLQGNEEDAEYRQLLSLAREKDIEIVQLLAGDRINLEEGLTLQILNPPQRFFTGSSAENNNSLVIRLEYGQASFLFTGDIEATAEKHLVESSISLESTFLQVPHHGSRTSSTEEFLEKVNPVYAVIPVGQFNHFGHPSPKVIERLNSRGVGLFRTDLHGAVIIHTDGIRYNIRTMLLE